ncbi:MAG TPA: TfoX/Sxy family protein [Burkholderiaceae bacterium]
MPAPSVAAARHEFVDHCVELLGSIGACSTRRMFGGHGFYIDGLFIALIAYERLFLKTDDHSRPRFLAAGCEPFVFEKQGEAIATSYFSAPEQAMESPALMQPWARLALEAALRARAAKPPAKPRKPAAASAAKKARPRKTRA